MSQAPAPTGAGHASDLLLAAKARALCAISLSNRLWGDKFDAARGDGLKAGGYLHLPKNTHHYEWSTEDTVIQLSGIGPVGMTYFDPSDDPRKN